MKLPEHPLYSQSWPDAEYRFLQIGFLVDDIVAAALRWGEVHAVGPFHVLPVVEQRLVSNGQQMPVSLQVGVAQAGPVQVELIQQHCDRPSIYRDWSRGGTSAIHQLATVTAHYEAKKAQFCELGYEIAAESESGAMRVAYVDTVADFGFYTEVVEHSEVFLAQLSEISETCARWDGNDPVRLLTRDGYRVPEGL